MTPQTRIQRFLGQLTREANKGKQAFQPSELKRYQYLIMCGRFKAGFEFREIKVRWQVFNDLDFTAHYNIAPTQTHRIIVERAGTVEARPMR